MGDAARPAGQPDSVELDSWDFHKDKIAFETDRERDATTLARGLVTVRVTEERLEERPGEEAERLLRILEARRRRHRSPPPPSR